MYALIHKACFFADCGSHPGYTQSYLTISSDNCVPMNWIHHVIAYSERQKIWLSSERLCTDHLSQKLDHRYIGPLYIIQLLSP